MFKYKEEKRLRGEVSQEKGEGRVLGMSRYEHARTTYETSRIYSIIVWLRVLDLPIDTTIGTIDWR